MWKKHIYYSYDSQNPIFKKSYSYYVTIFGVILDVFQIELSLLDPESITQLQIKVFNIYIIWYLQKFLWVNKNVKKQYIMHMIPKIKISENFVFDDILNVLSFRYY